MSLSRTKVVAALTACGSLLAFAPTAPAAIDEINTKRLREQVTVAGILQHERAFQRIANQNGGTRASGTPGYAASVAYVRGRLERAGYDVSEQTFAFPFFTETGEPALEQVSPAREEAFETGTFEFSGSGDVTGRVVPIDLQLPPGPVAGSSTSGCQAADFPAPGDAPAVALVQRGGCTFGEKAANAQAAGYDAVVIFNEGQEGRQDLFIGTLGTEESITIPVVGLSFADASELVATGEVSLRVSASTSVDLDATTSNLIADSPEGDEDRTIVVGAHLDSVVEGPGINDNGSGTAGILEIAEEMSENGIRPRNRVRFAFWGAEESGLVGSTYYVDNLDEDEAAQIYANLNFDMIGSPNYVRFVYDGDGSDTPVAGPPGSGQIEEIFTRYFASQGLESEPTEFSGRSDYGPFIEIGIPAGGLFSGAEGIKTEEQAEIYGGTAGLAYDPCYHEACDTISNVSTKALFELGDAAAHAVLTLARTRSGFFEDESRRAKARRGVKVQADVAGAHSAR
jgi:Zn-dependent M28 family amino/carboxypeptidase